MWEWLVRVLGEGFMPHGHCYLWSPTMVALQVISNFAIGAAYVSISATLYYIVRKIRDVPFSWMYLAFGIFIITCGLTHFTDVVTIWHPIYWFDGGLRAVTAVASVGTAFLLFPLVPKAIALAEAAAQSHERGTKLETAYEDLARAHEYAKEMEAAKTAFFANVSHELRTPLTLILGPIDRLLADPTLASSTREDLSVARRNATTLLKHVNELLDVSRLEAGKLEPTWSDVDLASVVRSTAGLFDSASRDRAFDLAVDAPETLLVQVDADMIQRVLANLVSNAVKHVPASGVVRIALGGDEDSVRLVVEDNGPGVPDDAKDAVFERFRQAAGTHEQRVGGSGLGLAIAKDFVQLHRGTIVVVDRPGGGARFEIVMPRRAPSGAKVRRDVQTTTPLIDEDARSPRARTSSPPRAEAGAPVVLVVEDNPDLRGHITRVLADGHDVRTATDGADALETLKKLRVDVIVTDLMMPNMNGEELVRALRADASFAETPILVLSARAEDATRVAVLRAGANDYVTKPFSAEELRARVENLIERSRARELRVALRAAEAASRAKQAFLSLMSHEIRTPIAAIDVQLELLARREGGRLGEPFDRARSRMRRSLDRLASMLESVLEYANLESGTADVSIESIDVAEVASALIAACGPRAEAKGLRVEVDIPRELPRVRGDRRLLSVALGNLLDNAIAYTDRGTVRLSARRVGGEVRIDVTDTGRGITLAQQSRMFVPFEHLEPLANKHAPGAGLGLAVVRMVHETIGGRVELSSRPGEGTTFSSLLPIAT